MKRSFLIILTAFGINALVAQTNSGMDNQTPAGVNTPATVSNKFKTDNPNANANWVMDGDNYSASYRDQLTNLDRTIVYDRNGNIVHSDYELDYASYPKAISDYYVATYPRDQYKVWSSEDENGKITYFSKHNSNIDWFDKDGNYLSAKPNSPHKISSTKKVTK